MDTKLHSFGYEFDPSKYTPPLGYSRLSIVISSQPTKRFFDVKAMHVPTFDGHYYHQTQVTRHGLSPDETLQVCLGELRLESYQGESLWVFSYGGVLRTKIEKDELICELSSSAPLFEIKDSPESVSRFIADEILDMLALVEPKLNIQQDELYSRLASFDPYQVFLTCLVSLQNRIENTPASLHREKYHRVVNELHKVSKIIKNNDDWDGRSPTLEVLLSGQTENE